MTIARRVEHYLYENRIRYETLAHLKSSSSLGSAISSNIPLRSLVKAVVLIDHEGRKLMAILPANGKINILTLNHELYGEYRLANENELANIFHDCSLGAIPPVAEAYNMSYVCDQQLDRQNVLYFEAGDHETLIKVDHEAFESMVSNGKHLSFSRSVYH